MTIVPLPLPPDAEARALLHHVLEHGDVLGRDSAGRTIIRLAVDGCVFDKLMGFDAYAAELEDGGDAEPDADDERDGAPFYAARRGAAEGHQAQAALGPGSRSG